MDKYLNRGIKDVISEFPPVGDLLNHYEIGCVTCNVGTCLLKDIISIHNLPKDQEVAMMKGVEKLIYPERDIDVPEIVIEKPAARAKSAAIGYSTPIKMLVDEHDKIRAFLAKVPGICEILSTKSEFDRELILDCVFFIRNYADKFHHAKEEDILFKYVDENNDIIKAMYEEHTLGRGYVRSMVEAAEKEDRDAAVKALNDYCDLLTQHTKKEDEILYPWIDRELSTRQVGEMYEKFSAVNKAYGSDVLKGFDRFLESLNHIL